MTVITDEKAIDRVLNLGVADVIIKKDIKKKLMSGKKLRIKLGIDPTGFDLHLGHMVVIHKMRELQDLGHQLILLFGNFTGQIGDPTGKDKTRTLRTQEELEGNAKDYLEQASKVLDVDKVEVRWNADWLAPMSFKEVVKLASLFTVSQMLERDMFQKRIENEQPISVHEFMYPLMQGYDSVALKADIELGGTDRTFNLLAGRPIQKAFEQVPQNIITMPILVGTNGTMKMGKSTGNYIAVADSAEEMFGKTMSIPDSVILDYFELAARVGGEELDEIGKRLKSSENPRDIKIDLAKRIITIYHDEESAQRGEEHFKTVFQKKELPDEIPEVKVALNSPCNIVDLISELELAGSKSEARRLVEGGAVKWNSGAVSELDMKVDFSSKEGGLLQVGKRKFRRVYSQS